MHHRDILPSGTTLDGKYRIGSLIGSGGFGMTYQALDLGLDMPVAIKEYYPAQFGTREATLSVRPASEKDRDLFDRLKESFLREARTLAQLRHRCIVRVMSVFEGHGTAYMVMEFESGKSLKAWLEGLGRLPTEAELNAIVLPLLDALELIHQANFLHRDIAPDNIIVRADGSPVLLDFGAARRVMAELSGALTGIVKQGYSPQEQYANDPRAQGAWSDIYALGATLYRCVSGSTPAEATLRMLDDPTIPAVEIAKDKFSPSFLSAIDHAMATRPKDRPQSIAEFRRLVLGGAPTKSSVAEMSAPTEIAAPPDPSLLTSLASVVPPPPASDGFDRIKVRSESQPRPPRRALRGVAFGVGAIVVLGIVGALLANRGAEQRPPTAIGKTALETATATSAPPPARAETVAISTGPTATRSDSQTAPRQTSTAAPASPPPAASEAAQIAAGFTAAIGACIQCDEVKKILSPADYAEIERIPRVIGETWVDVKDKEGPRENANARRILEYVASQTAIPSGPSTEQVIQNRRYKCTKYDFGFLSNAAELTGTHQCEVKATRVNNALQSFTVQQLTGDGFFAEVRPLTVKAGAFAARTFLKGHAITRYNPAIPKNRENTNYGNMVGLQVNLGGKIALISINKNGFTSDDPTYFQVMLLE
jgi:serine/threonine protein kinase